MGQSRSALFSSNEVFRVERWRFWGVRIEERFEAPLWVEAELPRPSRLLAIVFKREESGVIL